METGAAVNAVRDVLVALPAHGDDVYRRHQLVWRAVRGQVRSGQDFLFAAIRPQMVMVRSQWLSKGQSSAVRDGTFLLDLVTARRDGQRLLPVAAEDVPGFCDQLLARHGFTVTDVGVRSMGTATGVKQDRTQQRALHIRLPVAQILVQVRVANAAASAIAWRDGIGRGKRFGFGMLRSLSIFSNSVC